MLYKLLFYFQDSLGGLNVFRYITFRTVLAMLTTLAVSLLMGPWVIEKLRELNIGDVTRKHTPQEHSKVKKATPTMGGVLILLCLTLAVVAWGNPETHQVWVALLVTLGFGAIGFVDDYMKIKKKPSGGMRGKVKLLLMILVAGAGCAFLMAQPGFSTKLYLPFLKNVQPDLGLWYLPFAIFVVVGAGNAVNLTDGLDGLASGPAIISSLTYTFFCYAAGHSVIAEYLQIAYIPGAGEVAIFCAALAGGTLGFLWFNTYPAQVFMGDVGSLAIGGALGIAAIICKFEIVLGVVGGVFVMETLSVIIQVLYYKRTKRRIFLMAPIHHHFEKKGWEEPKITVRFWIISIILALIAFATLKVR
ncbi:MAG: phospho-N-acetylmuramoyl-pentapeptide-transferase [Deltaproteobacteria bacterium]|nr:MAG: phospho-N-acetylmuramoyl-pentapeptide-transferase [Deltaproteobacteria bacterium]